MSGNSYSVKERMVAKVLSKLPGLKRIVKNVYVLLNAAIYKKPYVFKKDNPEISDPLPTCILDPNEESFFGYYDKCPVNKDGWVINHVSTGRTQQSVKKGASIKIVLYNIYSHEEIEVGETTAFSWQQGSRTQWIDDDRILYNIFDENSKSWKSKLYSVSTRSVERIFDAPVQDAYLNQYLLGLDYQRLYTLTGDYGYQNKGMLSKESLYDLDSEGISIVDFESGQKKVLATLREIINIQYEEEFEKAVHSVNHIMINPSGTAFIFIHRYYVNGVRKDRLLLYDFKDFKLLSDHGMVSHCCWFNDNTIYGYLRYDGTDGYYFLDINTSEFRLNKTVTNLGMGDGHPTVHGDAVIFDTYPDKSRMQSLFLYNHDEGNVIKLLEVYQSTKFKESSRCDLHPRFGLDGQLAFFDSVFNGRRKQYYINLKK